MGVQNANLPSTSKSLPLKSPKMDTTMIEMTLKRSWYTNKSTMGIISIGGEHWFTLEDPVRQIKVATKTAIPAGRYRVIPHVSYTAKEIRPMLLNVPNYMGVFLHIGNNPENTDGCILPGKNKGDNYVFDSGKAYNEVCAHLCDAWTDLKETWITIIDIEGHPWFDEVPNG